MPLQKIALVLSGLLIFSSCSSPADSNTSEANSPRLGSSQEKVREGLDELQGLITLSAEPEEVLWTEEVIDATTAEKSGRKAGTKRLLAVFRFEPGGKDDFAPFLEGGSKVSVMVEVEDWFPAELIAQGQASGDRAVKGTAVGATPFLKAPYTEGRLVRVDGSAFYILELFAQ